MENILNGFKDKVKEYLPEAVGAELKEVLDNYAELKGQFAELKNDYIELQVENALLTDSNNKLKDANISTYGENERLKSQAREVDNRQKLIERERQDIELLKVRLDVERNWYQDMKDWTREMYKIPFANRQFRETVTKEVLSNDDLHVKDLTDSRTKEELWIHRY